MQISDKIFLRFEPEIKHGTLYIYDKENEKIYKSQKIAYDVLKNVDKGDSREIAQLIKGEYKEFSFEEVEKATKQVIKKFYEIGVIVD